MPVSVQVAKLKQELARVGVPVPKGKKAVLVKALQDFLDTQHQASVPQIASPVAAGAQAEEGAGKPVAADRAPEQDAAPAPKRAKLDNDAAATDDAADLASAAVKIQAVVRGVIQRKELVRQKAAAVKIQAVVRGSRARKDLVKQKRAATKIQAVFRGHVARRHSLTLKDAKAASKQEATHGAVKDAAANKQPQPPQHERRDSAMEGDTAVELDYDAEDAEDTDEQPSAFRAPPAQSGEW